MVSKGRVRYRARLCRESPRLIGLRVKVEGSDGNQRMWRKPGKLGGAQGLIGLLATRGLGVVRLL